ncbi:MAG TPA: MarR family transcriptional regulator [Ktedonobacterales bacterium]|nr:MarR family transcriptional regulator [Ktedonobacterales bacterium]
MSEEHEPISEDALNEAVRAQRAVYHALMRLSAPDWLELDLPTGQLKTLMTLDTHEGMTVSEVAEALHVGKSAASMLVDKLVQQGYAERSDDPRDRRRAIVAPSATGAALAARLRQGGGEQRMTRLMRQLSADDLAALSQGLRALAIIAEREAGAQTAGRADQSSTRDDTAMSQAR